MQPRTHQQPLGEIVLALPEHVETARHARSTLILQSIENVRSDGQFEAYFAQVEPRFRDTLIGAIVGTWIPMDAALAHYAACDRLGYSKSQQIAMGRKTVEKTAASLAGTALMLAKQAGTTPWTVIAQFGRFWPRGYDGGGVAVYKRGPKEARLHVVQLPVCVSPFYRNALNGFVSGMLALFCAKVYLSERPPPAGPHSVAMQMQWA